MTRKERNEVTKRMKTIPQKLRDRIPDLWAYVTAPGFGEPRHRAVIDQLIDLLLTSREEGPSKAKKGRR